MKHAMKKAMKNAMKNATTSGASRSSLSTLALLLVSACVPGTTAVEPGPPVDPVLPPRPPIGGSMGPGVGGGPPAIPGAGGAGGSRSGPLPGPTVSAAKAPPALSGGTLLVLGDGRTAFAADPDRDQLSFVDLGSERLLAAITLSPGDEPGRAVEARNGDLLVVLRGGGGIAVVDGSSRTLRTRVPVCGAPRGIDHDRASGLTHVACAGGELVSLAPDTFEVARQLRLEDDLRDLVVVGDRLFVSRFRAAEALVLDAEGQVIERRLAPGSAAANRTRMADPSGVPMRSSDPSVAWRMRRAPSGDVVMLHQEASNSELRLESGGYGGGPCRTPVGTAVTEFRATGGAAKTSAQLFQVILPVDFAYSGDGRKIALVAAGNDSSGARSPSVVYMDNAPSTMVGGDCVLPPPPDPIEFRQPLGRPIAVAFDGQGRVIVQTREPARIEILTHRGGTIKLSDESRADTGHQVFHMATNFGLACASCHPEAMEDGQVWRFAKLGVRRTQSLRGGILATAPFHWDGQMRDLRQLMTEVFTGRMGGPTLDGAQLDALASWMDRLPAAPTITPTDPEAVERGRVLFNDARVGCMTCHGGPHFTNNTTVAVGTGEALQVPSLLGLGSRAPYMHDGCAKTLLGRFDAQCGGSMHGSTSDLTPTQLADLVAYLGSL
jgi:hypothetical protein